MVFVCSGGCIRDMMIGCASFVVCFVLCETRD